VPIQIGIAFRESGVYAGTEYQHQRAPRQHVGITTSFHKGFLLQEWFLLLWDIISWTYMY